MTDYVLYKVTTDNDQPQLMVGRDLADIVRSCNEWCGIIKNTEFVADIDYITLEAANYAKE